MIKSIVVSTVIVVVAQALPAIAAMDLLNSSTVIGGGVFKTSKNVRLTATATTTVYSAIAGHGQGDKEFGTQHQDSKLFSRSKAIGTPSTTCDNSAFDFSSWTSQ
jgi:hypothetical protein